MKSSSSTDKNISQKNFNPLYKHKLGREAAMKEQAVMNLTAKDDKFAYAYAEKIISES